MPFVSFQCTTGRPLGLVPKTSAPCLKNRVRGEAAINPRVPNPPGGRAENSPGRKPWDTAPQQPTSPVGAKEPAPLIKTPPRSNLDAVILSERSESKNLRLLLGSYQGMTFSRAAIGPNVCAGFSPCHTCFAVFAPCPNFFRSPFGPYFTPTHPRRTTSAAGRRGAPWVGSHHASANPPGGRAENSPGRKPWDTAPTNAQAP